MNLALITRILFLNQDVITKLDIVHDVRFANFVLVFLSVEYLENTCLKIHMTIIFVCPSLRIYFPLNSEYWCYFCEWYSKLEADGTVLCCKPPSRLWVGIWLLLTANTCVYGI